VLVGLGAFVLVFLTINALVVVASVIDEDNFKTEDLGNALEKANAVARYGDQKLEAVTAGRPIPKPPAILANQGALQLALAATLVSQVVLLGVVGIASKQHFRGLMRALGLNRLHLGSIWLPLVLAPAAVAGIATYQWLMSALDVWWLEPQSTVPIAIVRNDLTLSVAAVVTLVGAPFSEELFFRGFVFSGLSKWGFWPAASISAALFALVHFDLGSLIPFFAIAIGLAWVYRRSGTLWHSMVFHALFNGISFSVLVGTTR